MSNGKVVAVERCPRCGAGCAPNHKFCAECGMFLRDPFLDQRLLLAMTYEGEGRNDAARQELERILESAPDHVLANHLLGSLYFHEGVLEVATRHYQKAVAAAPTDSIPRPVPDRPFLRSRAWNDSCRRITSGPSTNCGTITPAAARIKTSTCSRML